MQSDLLPHITTCHWRILIYLLESSPFPSHQGVALKMHINCYHGLLNFHSDDIFIDIIAFIFTGDAVINILPQIMFAGMRRRAI